jgi:UDPglucose--hexose-1-phosphate uridylyltransferase
MNLSELDQTPHGRFNPLVREWIVVSPQRTQRPWLGKVEQTPPLNQPQYDPGCYLCPGNERAGGVRNPEYSSTFVFDNDYAALLPENRPLAQDASDLLLTRSEQGICRVVCFSPRHDLAMSRLNAREIGEVVDTWICQTQSLEALGWVKHVQIFENRGALMGASNPHPHGQIWANGFLPNVPQKELASFQDYYSKKHSCLLCDYLKLELSRDERVICQNEAFAAVVPFWAVWPFEVLLLSKRHLSAIDELSWSERDLLAEILRRVAVRYDNVFETAFPYSMGFHQRPTDGQAHPEWHFHAHYFPPLLRSATIQKFMVGFEMLGSPQRDITPESAAAKLREVSEVHYLDRVGKSE